MENPRRQTSIFENAGEKQPTRYGALRVRFEYHRVTDRQSRRYRTHRQQDGEIPRCDNADDTDW